MLNDLEAFTCLMYGHARERSINSVRSIMLRKMVGEDEQLTVKCKVDLSRLPLCRDNLVPHIWRVKRAEKADFWRPKAYDPGQGWQKTEEGILEPVWSCGPVLPPSLIDLLEKTNEQKDDGKAEEEELVYNELLDEDE